MKKLLAAIITAGAIATAALGVGSPAGAQTNTEVTNPVYTVDSGNFELATFLPGQPGVVIHDQIVGGELYANGTGFIELARTGNIEVTSLSVTPHVGGSITFTYGGWTFSGELLPTPPGQYEGNFQGSPSWPLALSKISQLVLTPVS